MLTSVSAGPASVIAKDPLAGTQLKMAEFVSDVRTIGITMLLVLHKLFVTVTVWLPAAMFTVPAGVLIVWLPVVPGGVIVLVNVGFDCDTFVAFSASVVIRSSMNFGGTFNGIDVTKRKREARWLPSSYHLQAFVA